MLLFGPAGRDRPDAGRRRGRRRAGLDREGARPRACGPLDARRLDRAGRQGGRRRPRRRARLRRLDRRGARRRALPHQARPRHPPARARDRRCPSPARRVLLLDVGANVEVRPEHLVQFAYMGAAFAQAVLGVERPRVALLSNGEEPRAGTPDVIAAHQRLAEARRPAELRRQRRGHADHRGRRRRRRDGRLHRQHHAQADRGRLRQAAAHDPRRRDGEPARARSAGCCCAARCAACATRSIPSWPAAPTCSGCAARRRRARPLHPQRLRARDRRRGARGARGRRRPHARRAGGGGGAARRPRRSEAPASVPAQ